MQPLYNATWTLCIILTGIFVYLEYFASPAIKSKWARVLKSLVVLGNDRYLSLGTFAECERQLSGVSRVVVICSQVERPTSELAKAVIDNFAQGIKYEFFVGHGAATRDQLETYHSWFKSLFDVARPLATPKARETRFEDLFLVRVINIVWHGSPYVFHVMDRSGEETVNAYRGLDLRSGISNYYERASLQESMTIISLCAAASTDFREALPVDVSDDGKKVVYMPPQRGASGG